MTTTDKLTPEQIQQAINKATAAGQNCHKWLLAQIKTQKKTH